MAADKGSSLGTRVVERFTRRVLALAGQTVPNHIAGDVTASLDVRPVYLEDFYDFGLIPWAIGATQGAIAAEYSYLQIQAFWPAGYDCVIQGTVATAQSNISIGTTATFPDVLTLVPTHRDMAWGSVPIGSVTWAGTGTDAAIAGAVTLATGWPANVPWTPGPGGLVLRQGRSNVFGVWHVSVNTALTANVWGYLVPRDMTTA